MIRNSRGFSLLEVTMAIGLMSVAALGFMRFIQNKTKAQKAINSTAELSEFYIEVRGYLRKPGVCKKTFEYSGFGNGFALDKIRSTIGKDRYVKGQQVGMSDFYLTDIRVDEFTKETYKGQHRGEAVMKLVFEKKKKSKSYGAKKLERVINLDFHFSKGWNIIDCSTAGSLIYPAIQPEGGSNSGGSSENIIEGIKKQFENSNGKSVDAKELQEKINSNPDLKKLMNTIEQVKEMNQRMEKMLKEN